LIEATADPRGSPEVAPCTFVLKRAMITLAVPSPFTGKLNPAALPFPPRAHGAAVAASESVSLGSVNVAVRPDARDGLWWTV